MDKSLSLDKQRLRYVGYSLLLAIVVLVPGLMYLTLPQALLLSTIVLMVSLWTNEGLPLAAVSMLPVILFPSFDILSTKQTAINYANPIVFLFIGGFFIAIAVEKTALHKWIAARVFSFFPASPRGIIFSLMVTSGLLSSVLSNTTTTLLLLPIALFLTDHAQIKLRLALAIAYGASIGGILTPIGTPPNLILMGFLEETGQGTIPFMQWVVMVAPLVALMFIVAGYVLSIGTASVSLHADLKLEKQTIDQKKVSTVILILIFMLFLNAPIKPYYNGLGLNESAMLLFAGLLLFFPVINILNWSVDKNKIPFQIIFLFGAGFAIAKAFMATGMAEISALYLSGFSGLPLIVFLLLLAALVTFTTEITSNTALISIILPILYEVANNSGLNVTLILMLATVCASYAFMLPIATPPNAAVMSSGIVNVKTMAKYGIVFNLAGIVLVVSIASLYWRLFLE